MAIDIVAVQMLVVKLCHMLEKLGATGCGLVRCRTLPDEHFCHIERYHVGTKDRCTPLQFLRDWGPIGYGHVVEPVVEDAFGWTSQQYALRSFAGLRRDIDPEPFWIIASEDLKPLMEQFGAMLRKQGLDRLYLARFSGAGQIGDGYAYCLRHLTGEPCQYKEHFKGELSFQAGLVSLDGGHLCESEWRKSYLTALEGAIRAAGLSTEVGHAGGRTKTKAPVRTTAANLFSGANSHTC